MRSAEMINIMNSQEFFNFCRDKLATYEFSKSRGMLCPETEKYSHESLQRFIKKYGKAVLKPRYGKKGENISLVSNTDEFSPCDKNEMLVQEPIYGRLSSKKSFDLRVFVQNTQKPKLYPYFRVSEEFASNIAKGGMAEDFDVFLKAVFKDDGRLKNKILDTCNNIVEILDKNFSFFECGLDLMIDKNKRIYLLEINSNCRLSGLFRLRNPIDSKHTGVSFTYLDKDAYFIRYCLMIKEIYSNRVKHVGKEKTLEYLKNARFSSIDEMIKIKNIVEGVDDIRCVG